MTNHPDSTPAKYPAYTNLALGDGLLDQLMRTVQHHLDLEYKKNRIKGADYAKVYVGAIESVMMNTTQYLLGTMLINEQKAKAEAETSLTLKQEEKIDGDIRLIDLEEIKLRYQIDELLPLEKLRVEADIIKITNEGLLIAAQILKIDQEIINLIAQASLLGKQEDKIDQEILFLIQKVITESANTTAGVADPESLIGKQISLLSAQKLGFAGDIQVKLAKLYADYDAVFQSVHEVPEDVTLHPAATTAIAVCEGTASAISTS